MSISSNYRVNRNGSAKGGTVTVGASVTAVVSKEFSIHYGKDLLIAALVKNVTNTSGTTVLKLQHASKQKSDGTWAWTDVKSSAALTTAASEAVVEIRVLAEAAADQAKIPLGIVGRVVAVTGVADAVKVVAVDVIE